VYAVHAEDTTKAHHAGEESGTVLLPTARVLIDDVHGNRIPLRALMDTGSQSSVITERAVQLLGLKRVRARVAVSGITDGDAGTTNGKVELTVRSHLNPNWNVRVSTYVLIKIAGTMPSTGIPTTTWDHLQGLSLGDLAFDTPGIIDIPLGADVTLRCLEGTQVESPPSQPVAQLTRFGWIIGGDIEHSSSRAALLVLLARLQDKISGQVEKIWGGLDTLW